MREQMNKEIEETARKVADYSGMEKEKLTRRIHWLFLAAVACFILYMVLDIYGLTGSGVTEKLADASLGVVFGMLMMGALYTSRFFPKIAQTKKRWLRR